MRAILIDAFDQKITEIDLPTEVSAFQKQVRLLLRTDEFKIVHSNEMLSVIIDEFPTYRETPAFWSPLMEDLPMFGNIICVGRNPFTKEMDDLFEDYKIEDFNTNVRWCDKDSADHYRKIANDYARSNRT